LKLEIEVIAPARQVDAADKEETGSLQFFFQNNLKGSKLLAKKPRVHMAIS